MGFRDELEKHFVESGQAPAGWSLSTIRSVGDDGKGGATHAELYGAVYEHYVRGPKTGRTNWKKPIKGTKRTFILTFEEYRAIGRPKVEAA